MISARCQLPTQSLSNSFSLIGQRKKNKMRKLPSCDKDIEIICQLVSQSYVPPRHTVQHCAKGMRNWGIS